MYRFVDWYHSTLDFMSLGGDVLVWLAILMLFMWILIIERIIYFKTTHKRHIERALETWEARSERKSWDAHQIREALISRVRMSGNATLPIIKTLVALCPLLGLLGTVTGMIAVFDVMAIAGTGNARSMADGVSKATIPTMAGMVGALSGVFASTILSQMSEREGELLQDHLTMDH